MTSAMASSPFVIPEGNLRFAVAFLSVVPAGNLLLVCNSCPAHTPAAKIIAETESEASI